MYPKFRARHSRSQILCNGKSNVLPLNIDVGNYVMMGTKSKRNQNFQANCNEPMRVVEAEHYLAFVIKDLDNVPLFMAHAHRITLYPVSSRA